MKGRTFPEIMTRHMNHPFTDLTRELLSMGVFNHLPDNEVSRLHWIILQDQRSPGGEMMSSLLPFWYRGDYYSSNIPPRLLQRCNEFLQGLGQPLIDVFMEDAYEA